MENTVNGLNPAPFWRRTFYAWSFYREVPSRRSAISKSALRCGSVSPFLSAAMFLNSLVSRSARAAATLFQLAVRVGVRAARMIDGALLGWHRTDRLPKILPAPHPDVGDAGHVNRNEKLTLVLRGSCLMIGGRRMQAIKTVTGRRD